jgi:hypothetical protein
MDSFGYSEKSPKCEPGMNKVNPFTLLKKSMVDVAANAGKLMARGRLSAMKSPVVKGDSFSKLEPQSKPWAQPQAGSGKAGDPDSKSSNMIMHSMRTMDPVLSLENLVSPTIALDYNQLIRGAAMNMFGGKSAARTERAIDRAGPGILQLSNRALDSGKDGDESPAKSVNFRSPTGSDMKDKYPGLFPPPKKETGPGFELPRHSSLNRLPIDLPEIKDEPEDEAPYQSHKSLRINQAIKKSLLIDGNKFNKHVGGIQFSNTDYTKYLIDNHGLTKNYDTQEVNKVKEKLKFSEEIKLNLNDSKPKKDKINQLTNFSMISAIDQDLAGDRGKLNSSMGDGGEVKGIEPTVVGLNAKIMNRYPYFRTETPEARAGNGLVLRDKRRVMLGNLAGSGFLHSFEHRGVPESPKKFGGENEYGLKKGKAGAGGTMAPPSLTNGTEGSRNQRTFYRFLNQLKNVNDESL